jgi:pimeloyl-ACP methyl ester carboxylesterase
LEPGLVKKFLKYAALAVVTLVVAGGVGLWAWGNSRHARPAAEALAAMASDAQVTVEEKDYIVFRPASGEPRMGLIFYPGANCDIRGYAPVLRRLAAAGYFVVDVPMPLEFAFLAPNRALDVKAAFPAIHHWALMGHSLGGAMAATFAYNHPDAVDGLIILDSYPAPNNSLAGFQRPVWHIHRARPDGTPPQAFVERRALFPASSTWVPIPGGIHMYFGSFDGGGYTEDWAPSISRDEQHDRAAAAMLDALQAMTPAG